LALLVLDILIDFGGGVIGMCAKVMMVDLEQFCAAPELPQVERGCVRSVEPMSEDWRLFDGLWSIVEVTGLAPVEVLLGLLLGGLSIDFRVDSAINGVSGVDYYRRVTITYFFEISARLSD
jgi:hypothetical protein